MATQKRTSGTSAKKSSPKAGAGAKAGMRAKTGSKAGTKAGTGAKAGGRAKVGVGTGPRRASLKAEPQRRKRAPARAGAALEKVSSPRKAAAKTSSASRTGRKAGLIKRALKKGFSELAKVGS